MQINSISSSGYNKETPAIIETKLMEKGLVPTGNYAQDMQTLQSSSKTEDSEDSSVQSTESVPQAGGAQQTGGAQQSEPPWASIMQELGIEATGSQETDLSAISNAITELEAAAETDADKANVEGLQSQYEQIAATASSSIQQASQSMDNFTGMQSLGNMNKYLLGL